MFVTGEDITVSEALETVQASFVIGNTANEDIVIKFMTEVVENVSLGLCAQVVQITEKDRTLPETLEETSTFSEISQTTQHLWLEARMTVHSNEECALQVHSEATFLSIVVQKEERKGEATCTLHVSQVMKPDDEKSTIVSCSSVIQPTQMNREHAIITVVTHPLEKVAHTQREMSLDTVTVIKTITLAPKTSDTEVLFETNTISSGYCTIIRDQASLYSQTVINLITSREYESESSEEDSITADSFSTSVFTETDLTEEYEETSIMDADLQKNAVHSQCTASCPWFDREETAIHIDKLYNVTSYKHLVGVARAPRSEKLTTTVITSSNAKTHVNLKIDQSVAKVSEVSETQTECQESRTIGRYVTIQKQPEEKHAVSEVSSYAAEKSSLVTKIEQETGKFSETSITLICHITNCSQAYSAQVRTFDRRTIDETSGEAIENVTISLEIANKGQHFETMLTTLERATQRVLTEEENELKLAVFSKSEHVLRTEAELRDHVTVKLEDRFSQHQETCNVGTILTYVSRGEVDCLIVSDQSATAQLRIKAPAVEIRISDVDVRRNEASNDITVSISSNMEDSAVFSLSTDRSQEDVTLTSGISMDSLQTELEYSAHVHAHEHATSFVRVVEAVEETETVSVESIFDFTAQGSVECHAVCANYESAMMKIYQNGRLIVEATLETTLSFLSEGSADCCAFTDAYEKTAYSTSSTTQVGLTRPSQDLDANTLLPYPLLETGNLSINIVKECSEETATAHSFTHSSNERDDTVVPVKPSIDVPYFAKLLADVTMEEGTRTRMKVIVTGYPVPTVEWVFSETNIHIT